MLLSGKGGRVRKRKAYFTSFSVYLGKIIYIVVLRLDELLDPPGPLLEAPGHQVLVPLLLGGQRCHALTLLHATVTQLTRSLKEDIC